MRRPLPVRLFVVQDFRLLHHDDHHLVLLRLDARHDGRPRLLRPGRGARRRDQATCLDGRPGAHAGRSPGRRAYRAGHRPFPFSARHQAAKVAQSGGGPLSRLARAHQHAAERQAPRGDADPYDQLEHATGDPGHNCPKKGQHPPCETVGTEKERSELLIHPGINQGRARFRDTKQRETTIHFSHACEGGGKSKPRQERVTIQRIVHKRERIRSSFSHAHATEGGKSKQKR
mmetsp:Transcript_18221/g.27490  ORF Transcript_18221/g.27490 Transcript_18221/m.27490 type:complete len:231 (+) Transcript_18221:2162-2854(+)